MTSRTFTLTQNWEGSASGGNKKQRFSIRNINHAVGNTVNSPTVTPPELSGIQCASDGPLTDASDVRLKPLIYALSCVPPIMYPWDLCCTCRNSGCLTDKNSVWLAASHHCHHSSLWRIFNTRRICALVSKHNIYIYISSPLLSGCYVIECIIFQIKPCNLHPGAIKYR